jgi:hypothetical protein
VTIPLINTLFGGGDYWLARLLFQRGLAAIYLVAFLVALHQFLPLLGARGLVPVPRFLASVNFSEAPSIFHFYYSDRFLVFIAWLGIVLSTTALLGLSERLGWWFSAAIWGALWLLYLSIVNVGQMFYAFGWESLLLEAGFLAIFSGSRALFPSLVVMFLLRWLVFRVEFGAGLIKLRGDECWRNLTCLQYHHETQPMPNAMSWYFHNLPAPFHTLEAAGNFFFQLVVPFGLFLPQPIAGISAALIIGSQLWLVASGNFAWLNWIVIVLALSGFSNAGLSRLVPITGPPALARSVIYEGFVLAIALVIAFLSFWPIKNMLSRRQLMNASFNPWHLVNTYGAFGTVTKERIEVVIEGTRDSPAAPEALWREYEFKGKPGDPHYRPRQYAPYHLRLDWLMWFLPFNLATATDGKTLVPRYYEEWFIAFAEKLLANDPTTLKLVRVNPFPDAPPLSLRARLYRYHFTTPRERSESGAWWRRELVGEYLPPVSLTAPQNVEPQPTL